MEDFMHTLYKEEIARCHRMIPIFRDIKNGVIVSDHCTQDDAARLLVYHKNALERAIKQVAKYEQEARDAADYEAFKSQREAERLAS